MVSLGIWAMVAVLLVVSTCQAANYKWTDRDGSLHFSDTPPAYEIPQQTLNPADAEERPLLEKPLLVYSDNVFRLMLTAEQDDMLQFELIYTDIHRSFPEITNGNTRLQLCAVGNQEGYSYLEYSVLPVEGGNGTLQPLNRLSRQSPETLATGALVLSLYDYGTGGKKPKSLLKREIPFGKSWQKRAGALDK